MRLDNSAPTPRATADGPKHLLAADPVTRFAQNQRPITVMIDGVMSDRTTKGRNRGRSDVRAELADRPEVAWYIVPWWRRTPNRRQSQCHHRGR